MSSVYISIRFQSCKALFETPCIWEAPVPERYKCIWYEVVHDIKPTRQRLHTIKLVASDNCMQCMETDTLRHRLTRCGEADIQWQWTQNKLALILRTDPVYVLPEWLQRPGFRFWPRQKHRAVLWILACYVYFRSRHETTATTQEYFDFLKRTRWKLYRNSNRLSILGNYLEVLVPI